jgi:hypothetical protein
VVTGRVIGLDADEDEDDVVEKLAALAEVVQLPSLTARAAPSDLEAMHMASDASVEAKIRIFYCTLALSFFRVPQNLELGSRPLKCRTRLTRFSFFPETLAQFCDIRSSALTSLWYLTIRGKAPKNLTT